jgi:hypothetical protein
MVPHPARPCELQINTKQPTPFSFRETITTYASPDTAPSSPFRAVLLAAHAEARYLGSPPGRRLTLFGLHQRVMLPAAPGDLAG